MEYAEKKKIAEVVASIYENVKAEELRWVDEFDWDDVPTSDDVYDSFSTLLKEIEAIRATAHEKYNGSTKIRARKLREKADELLVQAKELEEEL